MKLGWQKYNRYIILSFSVLMIVLDQLFKWLAKIFLYDLPGRSHAIIKDAFHLTYIENRGAAFGMFDGKGIFLILLTSIIIGACIVLLLLGKIRSSFLMWSVGLIIGGGSGNLIDRIFRHYVIDYLDFRLINFAVFNFADCCVVIGTAMVLIYIIFVERKNTLAAQEKKDE